MMMTSVASATAPAAKTPGAHRTTAALGGFVKDRALATLLGETLFRDTVEVMSDSAALSGVSTAASSGPEQFRDNSAAGRVARVVLARRSLDKYLWFIHQAYDDTLWKGGDRMRIEQHFPLIWRTSIMLYESTLNASPHRVRVCTPGTPGDDFDCRDEIARAKVIPIPGATSLLIRPHQPNIG